MHRSHFSSIAAALVVLAAVAIAFVVGPVAALDGGGISPDPRTPDAAESQHNVRVVATENDTVVETGLRSVTVDYGVDERFNGSVANVSAGDVRVFRNSSEVGVENVTTNAANDRLTIALGESVPVSAGTNVIARIEDIANPAPTGEAFYEAEVTLANASNATDTATTSYALVPAGIDLDDQTVAPNGTQNLTVRGTVPNRGYVAAYTITDNGTAGELLGVTPSIPPNFNERALTNLFPLALNGNLTESRAVCVIPYYETTGGSQVVRAQQAFNRTADAPFRNDGVIVNDTGVVSIEGSSAANVTAPATCRPRPANVLTANETDNATNGSIANGTNGTAINGTNGTAINGTNGSAANATTVAGVANDTTPATTTEAPLPTTTATPDPTATPTETPEPTTAAPTAEPTTIGTATATPTATETPEPTTAGPTTTAESTTTAEPTTTSSSGPGFGLALAIGAMLAASMGLAVVRRR